MSSSPTNPNPPNLRQNSQDRARHVSGPPTANGGINGIRKSPGESPMKAPFTVAPPSNPVEEIHSTL